MLPFTGQEPTNAEATLPAAQADLQALTTLILLTQQIESRVL